MNIIDNLIDDHQKIRSQLNTILDNLQNSSIQSVEQSLIELDHLLNGIHEPKEEELFLAIISHSNIADTDKLLDGLISEHQGLRDRLKALVNSDIPPLSDSTTVDSLNSLIEAITLHMDYEEKELYPLALRHLSPSLSDSLLAKYQTISNIPSV
ncbi:MAG: hemerythrin domain-containing protein [Microgenomates group bacterium]